VLAGQNAQQAEADFVAQQPIQLARPFHIHEYISVYVIWQGFWAVGCGRWPGPKPRV
jgi:hypothetical protein